MTQLRLHSASALALRYPTSLSALLGACNGDAMSVGSNDGSLVDPPGACGDGVVQGPIFLRHPEDVEQLLDCEVVQGDLFISVDYEEEREYFSLAPLASLRQVGGNLNISGLSSLEGLEALEQVGALSLYGVGVSDLHALRNLRRVIWEPANGGYGGGITISQCPALQSLEGLEQLASWASLGISECPVLESLRGLGGPARAQDIFLYSLPALRDLRALDFLLAVDRSVLITGTGIENLTGFALRSTESLTLTENPNLTSLGTRRLAEATSLWISDNDSLLDVELPGLEWAHVISITGNDALSSVPRYGVNRREVLVVGPDQDEVETERYVFEVGNNAALTSVATPDGFSDVEQITIWSNPALTSIDLPWVASAAGLTVTDNATLRTLNAPKLKRVDDIKVINNPALSMSVFSGVQTFSTQIQDNLDEFMP
jgi:hypothetical protein